MYYVVPATQNINVILETPRPTGLLLGATSNLTSNHGKNVDIHFSFSSSEDESGHNPLHPVFGQLLKSYVDSQVEITDSMVVNVSQTQSSDGVNDSTTNQKGSTANAIDTQEDMFPEIGSESENAIQSTQPVTSLANNDSISKMHKSYTLSVKDFNKFGYSLIEISDEQTIPVAKLQNVLDSNMRSLVRVKAQCLVLIV